MPAGRPVGSPTAQLPTDLAFEETAVPERATSSVPNPYIDKIRPIVELFQTDGTVKGLKAIVTDDIVEAFKRKVGAAGRELGVTINFQTKEAGKGKAEVVFWPSTKRGRKESSTPNPEV